MKYNYSEADVLLLQSGDVRAVERWFRTFQKPLFAFILTRVSDLHDAEELCQNTFLSCLETLPLYRGTSSLFTWMCAVAKHEIADYFRKKYAKRALQLIPFGETLLPEHLHTMHDVSDTVRRVLKKLTQKERELLFLKYIDNASVKSIAHSLGMSMKSIESMLYRARKAFQRIYAEHI
ncbi:MAG: sigma-70 family RNA polymerase sigma factor [Candidatus Pacebacteria bacterium]|nr:sigma-70 family RNA polymerase sigma factor [Candidatus Paceibacterota bacterium]